MSRPVRRALALAVALLATAGCVPTADVGDLSPARGSGDSRETRPQRGDAPAQAPLAGRPGSRVRTTLATAAAALPVAAERRTGYDRDLFPHWSDADGNGCDTREEVLVTQNRAGRASLAGGCTVVGGEWFSYYDQLTTTAASSFDIDHLVPLAEAWDSGAHAWSAQRREAFANDLGDRRSLIAVSATSNRTKSDADPAQWMPAYKACVYISSWVAVKVRWGLSVDTAERRTLTRYAGSCGKRPLTVRLARLSGSVVEDARPSDAARMPAPAPSPAGASGGGGPDPRFDTCTAAIAAGYGAYRRGRDTEYDWYRDGDGDGTVCES